MLAAGALFAAIREPPRVEGGLIAGTPGWGWNVRQFRGIPFAAPPVGNLRWRPPQPVVAWQGVRAADRFSPVCMQRQRGLSQRYWNEGLLRTSEDCLHLNVWTPAGSAGGRNVSSLAGLRAMPTEAIVALAVKNRGGMNGPIVDGWFLPRDVRGTFASGKQNDVALVTAIGPGRKCNRPQRGPALTGNWRSCCLPIGPISPRPAIQPEPDCRSGPPITRMSSSH